MRIFDKLTGGGVDWMVELDSTAGVFRPGDTVSGRVRYTPKGDTEVRTIHVALVASEHYVQVVQETRSTSRGNTARSTRKWFSNELFHQEVEPSGPTTLPGQVAGEIAFEFQVPADALPSFDSQVLRLVWQVKAWLDVGGRDPSTERDLYVVLAADRLGAPEAAIAPSSADQTGTILIEPAPIVAGQAFRGALETAEQLDPRNVRVELKQRIETHGAGGRGMSIGMNTMNISLGGGGVADDRVLWSGQLTPAGAAQGGQGGQRYEFAGQLPPGPVGTLSLPHGNSTASIDIVISRRLMPDRHISRPVAIVTG